MTDLIIRRMYGDQKCKLSNEILFRHRQESFRESNLSGVGNTPHGSVSLIFIRPCPNWPNNITLIQKMKIKNLCTLINNGIVHCFQVSKSTTDGLKYHHVTIAVSHVIVFVSKKCDTNSDHLFCYKHQ